MRRLLGYKGASNLRAARLRLGKSGARDGRRRRAIPTKSPIQFASLLRFSTVAHPGYTVDSFAPAQLALRANLRLVYLEPAPALDCLSLLKCAIARVFAPTHVALRAAFARQCWFAFFAVCLTLRAALCSLPRNRPFACFPASARWHVFSAALRLPRSLPLISPYGLPAAGYPASPRWHVFPSPVSGFRFLLPPPSAIPASPREPLAFVLHVYFTALSSVALTNSPQMAKCHHD